MKLGFLTKSFYVKVVCIITTLLVTGAVAHARRIQTTNVAGAPTYQYKWDAAPAGERFNNSETVETEDNWVANGFVVVDAGTRLLSIEYPLGETFIGQPVTAVIYQGIDISDPSGLVRIQTTEALVTGLQGTNATIVLDVPVDLKVGSVFYAALLIRGVTGDKFPFFNDTAVPQGHSFFDVGPTQGAPYDLDVTVNATVNGGIHPVVDSGVQSPGNTFLRVNATTTP